MGRSTRPFSSYFDGSQTQKWPDQLRGWKGTRLACRAAVSSDKSKLRKRCDRPVGRLDCPRAGDEPSPTARTSRAPTRASAMGVSPHDYSVREKRLVSFFGKQVNSRKVSEPSFGFGTGTREDTEVRPPEHPSAE